MTTKLAVAIITLISARAVFSVISFLSPEQFELPRALLAWMIQAVAVVLAVAVLNRKE